MFRANWRSDTLEVDTKVTVSGASPKKAGAKGILIEAFTLPDGRILTQPRSTRFRHLRTSCFFLKQGFAPRM